MGSKERFISFVSMLAGADDEGLFFEEKMEQMADLFITEMDVDLSPYQSFKELKLLTPDWNPKQDILLIRDAVVEEMLMEPIFNYTLILKHEETQINDNILDMRVDYLITKLGLYNDFDHYHYLLRMALLLNQQ